MATVLQFKKNIFHFVNKKPRFVSLFFPFVFFAIIIIGTKVIFTPFYTEIGN